MVQGNAMALPWEDDRFSVVASLNCLKFVPDPPKALREMHRVLRPDGRLVVTIDQEGRQVGQVGRGRLLRPVAVERGRRAADDGGRRIRRRLSR